MSDCKIFEFKYGQRNGFDLPKHFTRAYQGVRMLVGWVWNGNIGHKWADFDVVCDK